MIRALWLALHNLAAVDDASEAALRAFVRRQAKVDALTFLTPDQAFSVIEALKGWCRRLGYVVDEDLLASKRALLRAIWHRLGELGALDNPSDFGLDGWISHRIVPRDDAVDNLTAAELDAAANRLGAWLRRETAE